MAYDRRELLNTLHSIRKLKTWQLVIILILFLGVSAIFLRLNNVGMIERRQAVYSADKAGDNEQIHDRLYDLQRYASQHMNAATGEVYLDHKYKRDIKAISDKLRKESKDNKVYVKADKVCRPRYISHGFFSMAYLNCIKKETAKYPGSNKIKTSFKSPDPALYRFEFYSPRWTFDFAGVSVLITFILLVVILVKVIVTIVIKLLLKRRYSSI